ncbi:hypothetical protein PG997_002531 [Apiospora hydei]|uniref:Nephrocystin 3-like N-terminal domain-containing protein n=1 Tax=Apiospora hydei TaxID=1337664 RepID=A0ABR1WWQ7_9PEZI
MDPFSAIGSVGNIVQYVGFAVKVLNSAKGMYTSTSAAGNSYAELESLAESMETISLRLQPSSTPSNMSKNEKALLDSQAKEQEKMEELEKNLRKYQEILTLQLQIMANDMLGQRLDDIARTGDIGELEMQSLSRNTDFLRSGIAASSLEPIAMKQVRVLLAQSDDAIEKAGQVLILKHLEDKNSGHLDSGTLDAMTKARSDYISWSRKNPFNLDGAIFHISGKPGAGKSTLVKYLSTHPATLDGLREWAAGKCLVVCQYFAWQPGVGIQNTIGGLVKTLLYHILQQAPELCKVAFEHQWQSIKAHYMVDDSHEEIREGLNVVLGSQETSDIRKLCFFIDGLDELREAPEDVVQFINDLGVPNVKLCVSSREWPEFQKNFKPCHKLTLQEINCRDIAFRIKDGLETVQDLKTRQDKEKVLGSCYELAHKSEGVFLWATLALGTVQESLTSALSAVDIAKKIASLPVEVEDLFQYIFTSMQCLLDESERHRAMVTLQLVLEHQRRLRTHYKALLLRRARKQILSRCFGLVEVNDEDELRFVHRDVFGFLVHDRTSEGIDALAMGFDMLEFMSQSFLATLKFTTPDPDYFEAPLRTGDKHHHGVHTVSLYLLDPPMGNLGSHNLSTSGTRSSLALSKFQHELLDVLDQSSISCSGKSRITKTFIPHVVEISTARAHSGYHVTHGVPEGTTDNYSRACTVADAVLLAVCSGINSDLVQQALALSRQECQSSRSSETSLPRVGLELQLWHALAGLREDSPEQSTFNTLDRIFREWCQDTRDTSPNGMWETLSSPELWRRLVWSGFWGARDGDHDHYTAPLEPLIRIFLLYGASPDISFQITRHLENKCCYWKIDSLEPPANHVILRRGLLPARLESHLIVQDSHTKNVFSLHELVDLWFPQPRAEVLQYLMWHSLEEGGHWVWMMSFV